MRATTPVDEHIGRMIRHRRKQLRMAPETLAAKIGTNKTTINAYEICETFVSAGRLYAIANALDVPVQFFFQDLK
jgi:transcriptional regulator with XRE-family HTH domain